MFRFQEKVTTGYQENNGNLYSVIFQLESTRYHKIAGAFFLLHRIKLIVRIEDYKLPSISNFSCQCKTDGLSPSNIFFHYL